MNEIFLNEWEDHFGKTEITKSKEVHSEDLSEAMHQQNVMIKRRVQELEFTDWYLHDAFDSVNVYSD